MNTLCTCPKETSLPDSCSKLCGIPGWKSRIALKGNNNKSDSTTRLLCLTYSSPCSIPVLQTARGSQKEMCFLSQVFQNKIEQSFCLAAFFFFSFKVIIRCSGRQEELQWPSADRTLDSKWDRFVLCSLSLWCVCACECAPAHAQWYCFCWLTRTSSRKSRCGFTCWNILFAPGNVFIDLATMTPFIEVSVLHLSFATQHQQFHDSPNVSARLIAAFCDLFQPPQIPCD